MAEGGVVLDASAILAVLYGEPGQEEVRRRLRGVEAYVGTVNLAEVVSELARGGFEEAEARETVSTLALKVVPLGEDAAVRAGMLGPETHALGLSFGDRACVALAQTIEASALTMDRAWDGLEGVEVIRRGEGNGDDRG